MAVQILNTSKCCYPIINGILNSTKKNYYMCNKYLSSVSSYQNVQKLSLSGNILMKNCAGFSTCIRDLQQESATDKDDAAQMYNHEQRQIQATTKKIIDQDINPYVDQWEEDGIFPAQKVFKKLGAAGLLGITKPTEYGGLGLGYKYNMAFMETLGTINCGSVPMAVSVQTDMATPALTWFGSDRLREHFLTPTISGDFVACLGVTEAQGGSDVAAIKTTAKRVGDDLVINGSKMWITNGCQAHWMCCLTNTSTDSNIHKNKSLIVLPMDTKGVKVARKLDKMGMRSSDTAEIFLEDVRVPAWYVIGDAGSGFTYQMMQFQQERLSVALLSLLPLEQLIKDAGAYAHTRYVFGQPLITNQSIHFRLAEMQTELEAFRALVYRAAELMIAGEDVTMLASMAKLKGGRLARTITDECLQIWGGMGFSNEVLVSRLYRDFRLMSIGGGSDEVMLGIISKMMGNLLRVKK